MPPSEKEKKQVVKLHKDFLDEIEGCNALERQGQQGFSSLFNIAERLPSLTSDKSKLGILNSMDRIHVLMQRRHFEALEKTSTYISQVIISSIAWKTCSELWPHAMTSLLELLWRKTMCF
ncbi:hypothetical protein Ae201684P_004590 [Aphanomyces euteiches]|nr:hypothetical protein Ae201684P_004590 [Aphanomyces euteiches]